MERKLTSILCADVQGYSRLMEDDEEATLRTLSAYRKIIDSLIETHRGRFVNSAGDSVLAEFTSVVEAVNCAVNIQSVLKTENQNLPPRRQMEFRVGVNLGDVMVEGEQIYGDGVNVAARLQSLADPGGICISGTVYEQVRDKLVLMCEDRGEQTVKNITRPVRVWRVLVDDPGLLCPERRRTRRYWRRGVWSLAGIAIIAATFTLVQHLSLRPPATHALIPKPPKPTLALPSIPSIAVLPFANLSGDPQQEYFSDGITDDLITDLSRVPKLFVIARTSSVTYKGKNEKAQTIGRELGVKYLLAGSARRAGNQIRINVQLVDAGKGNEIWSQRYDRQMGDIFSLQDEIVQSLTTTLGLQLSMLENGIVIPQRTSNLRAYDYYLRGLEDFGMLIPDALTHADKMFEMAISLDPRYADPYVFLALVSYTAHLWQWDTDPNAFERVEELARKAIFLDHSNSAAYALLGSVEARRNRLGQALADGQRSIRLDPNNAFAYGFMAETSGIAGTVSTGAARTQYYEAQIDYARKALRLDPLHPGQYQLEIGWAYVLTDRYRQGIDAFSRAEPNNPFTHIGLIYAYMKLGREQDARMESARVLHLAPNFSLSLVRKTFPGDWNTAERREFLDDLRTAGLR